MKKIKAYIDSQNKVAYFTNNLVLNTNGISPHEMYTLVTIMSQQFSKYDCIAKSTLVEKMKESGFNELATSIATKKLISKGLILIEQNEEEHGFDTYVYDSFKLTEAGIQWILDNEQEFNLEYKNKQNDMLDDLPF